MIRRHVSAGDSVAATGTPALCAGTPTTPTESSVVPTGRRARSAGRPTGAAVARAGALRVARPHLFRPAGLRPKHVGPSIGR